MTVMARSSRTRVNKEFGKYVSHASCWLLRVASHCELLRVTASYLSPGVSPTFVTIALFLPANYSFFR